MLPAIANLLSESDTPSSEKMDLLIQSIQGDLRSNDALRQSTALLSALQQSAAGRDVSAVARTVVEEIVTSPASAVCKKLAFVLLRSLPLPPDLWDQTLTGLRSDLTFPDPDVAAAALSLLPSVPSHLLPRLLSDSHAQLSAALGSPAASLRLAAADSLASVLARDDLVLLCHSSPPLLTRVSTWWEKIATLTLDRSDPVSKSAFESLGRLLQVR